MHHLGSGAGVQPGRAFRPDVGLGRCAAALLADLREAGPELGPRILRLGAARVASGGRVHGLDEVLQSGGQEAALARLHELPENQQQMVAKAFARYFVHHPY